LLARADRLCRRPELLVGPRLDLDDNEVWAATADQVQLAPPGSEAGTNHLVAAPPEEVRRRLLAGAAEL